ncbi:MAG: hypothetical protein GF401_07605 [Chitinivibrionales bacterium]|nr:hypothetical protein [Chitinivibrionales bacterium]
MLQNASSARGINPGSGSKSPLEDWDANAIPHDVMRSLVTDSGISYKEANDALIGFFIRSVAANPYKYIKSVFMDLYHLLFVSSEYYPDPRVLDGIGQDSLTSLSGPSLILWRFLRGLFHPPSWLLFIGIPFAAASLWKNFRDIVSSGIFFVVVAFIYGYILTAAVEVGFTRYTIPWLPLRAVLLGSIAVIVGSFMIRKLLLLRETEVHQRNAELT